MKNAIIRHWKWEHIKISLQCLLVQDNRWIYKGSNGSYLGILKWAFALPLLCYVSICQYILFPIIIESFSTKPSVNMNTYFDRLARHLLVMCHLSVAQLSCFILPSLIYKVSFLKPFHLTYGFYLVQ